LSSLGSEFSVLFSTADFCTTDGGTETLAKWLQCQIIWRPVASFSIHLKSAKCKKYLPLHKMLDLPACDIYWNFIKVQSERIISLYLKFWGVYMNSAFCPRILQQIDFSPWEIKLALRGLCTAIHVCIAHLRLKGYFSIW
jgi:hypothetical protein